MAKQKITAFGMDCVPRISRAQVFDALSSMGNISGKCSYAFNIGGTMVQELFFVLFPSAQSSVCTKHCHQWGFAQQPAMRRQKFIRLIFVLISNFGAKRVRTIFENISASVRTAQRGRSSLSLEQEKTVLFKNSSRIKLGQCCKNNA